MTSINDYNLDYKIEKACDRLFNLHINNYREDIFKNLRYYIKYDPELKTFRNLSLEHYNEVIEQNQNMKIAIAQIKIGKIINDKIENLANREPINIITESISASIDKKYNSTIENTKFMSMVGIGIGIVNIASMFYFFKK